MLLRHFFARKRKIMLKDFWDFFRSRNLFIMFGGVGQREGPFMDHKGARYHTDLPKMVETTSSYTGRREEIKTVAVQHRSPHVLLTHLQLAICNLTVTGATDSDLSALNKISAESTFIFKSQVWVYHANSFECSAVYHR